MALVKVKGLKGEVKASVSNRWAEYLPEAVERMELCKYFEEIKNHIEVTIKPNSLYIYCDATAPSPVQVVGHVNYEAACESKVFYDLNALGFILRTKDTGPAVIKIQVNNNYAGLFFTELRSFLLSDWTHDRECTVAFESIWPKMVKDFKLEPLAKTRKRAKKFKVTIGMDPEFELINRNGTIVDASCFYGDRFDYENKYSSRIGLDGACRQIEFRPTPHEKPYKVVENLKGLFHEFNEAFKNEHLSVKGEKYPLGGHIHVGGFGGEFYPPKELIKMLDAFVGGHLLNHSGEARGGYKELGAVRRQPWGFEYRTPPSSFLLKPEITRITLKIVKNLCETFINGDDISYNYPPLEEDYTEVAKISKSEYKKFKKFVKEFNKMPKIATAFWTNKKFAVKKDIIFSFRDDWDYRITDDLKMSLKTALGSLENKINFPIILYGLKEDRGLVATIAVPGIELLPKEEPLPRGLRDNGVWIGLPFIVRNSVDTYESYKKAIVAAIKKEVEKQLK